MIVVAIVFWLSVGLVLYAHAGYPVLLGLLAWVRDRGPGARRRARPPQDDQLPTVSVIVAAYAEQDVIADRVANIRALDYPPELIELIVACDGSPDETAARAREAGADLVLELPRGGKIRAQDAAVERAGGAIVAFSDANVTWERDALRRLMAPFADSRVGYVCGEVQLVDALGSNQEGLYWRYELALRALESRVRSVTGGNGAIYATRREAYLVVDPIMGHDLSFPFNMVKRGWLALAVREAQASEKMVPTIEGEFARKRRMMSHTWPIVAARRDAVAARLRPHVRVHDRLPPDPSLPHPVPARDRAVRQPRCCSARGGCTRSRSRSSSRCSWPRRSPASCHPSRR